MPFPFTTFHVKIQCMYVSKYIMKPNLKWTIDTMLEKKENIVGWFKCLTCLTHHPTCDVTWPNLT